MLSSRSPCGASRLFVSSLPNSALKHSRPLKYRRQSRTRRQSYQGSSGSSDVLEAFYYGRAFAQLLAERIGSAATEVFSELGKMDAERRQAVREFQEEVEARARAEMLAESSSRPTTSPASNNSSLAFGQTQQSQVELVKIPAPDLQEAVDELRAEIASARATLQMLKSKSTLRRSNT